MKKIWYKNWQDVWVSSPLKANRANLEFVRKNLAQNGVCEIFNKGSIVK
jgi:hypothetical protein